MQDYLSCIKIFFVILLGVLFKSQEFDNALSPEPVGENENNKLNLDRGEITYQDQTLEGKNVLEKVLFFVRNNLKLLKRLQQQLRETQLNYKDILYAAH